MAIFVNKEKIDDAVIEQEFKVLCQRYSSIMKPEEIQSNREKILADARENAIERMILTQEARKQVEDPAPNDVEGKIFQLKELYGKQGQFNKMSEEDLAKFRNGVRDSMKIEKYFDIICKDVKKPSTEECRKFYEDKREEFLSPEMVKASHIVRRPLAGQKMPVFYKNMREIRQRIIDGGDFAAAAIQHSECKDSNGDLGWFPRGEMVPLFDDVVFNLKVGEISDVFQTEFGFHLVKVTDKRPAEYVEFEKVQGSIEQHLMEELKNEEIGKAVDKLRETALIEEMPETS